MNSDQIITTVLGRCGRMENNLYLVTQARTELVAIQTRLEESALLPWFLLSAELSFNTTASLRTVTLPTSFLRQHEDFPIYRYDSTAADPYIRLNKDEFDILEAKYGGQSSDIPQEYALLGYELHLFPTPNAVYPLRSKWYEKQTTLDALASSNAWTDHAADLLIGELGVIIAGSYKKDQERFQGFGGEVARALQRILAFDEARKQALRDAQRGGYN